MTGDVAGSTEAGAVVALPPERRRGVLRLRLVLGVFWGLLSAVLLTTQVVSALVGPDGSSLAELYAAVELDRVDDVMLTPGLPADAYGRTTQQAWWDEAGQARTARWVVDRQEPGVVWSDGQTPYGEDQLDVTGDDVRATLAGLDEDLVVTDALGDPGPGVRLLGVHVPEGAGMVVAVFLTAWFATLVLLVNGPQPWRATRWAWFWLSAPPVGLLAFVVLSGPTPGLGITRPVGRRLTGGWALLISVVLSAALAENLWW